MIKYLKRHLFGLYRSLLAPLINRCFHEHLLRHTDDYVRSTWMGYLIRQPVLDLWVIQETLCDLKPDVLIESGTNLGGSAMFYAHLFDVLGHGRVISIDVDRLHDLSHPRVQFLIGSSTAPEIIAEVRRQLDASAKTVMVILDSDHSSAHVSEELKLYAPLVSPNSYCLVQDGVIDRMWFFRKFRPGPLGAIRDFLKNNHDFIVDEDKCNRFLVTHHPMGWLKRSR